MKVSFEINNQNDAGCAVGLLLALEEALRLQDGDMEAMRAALRPSEEPAPDAVEPEPSDFEPEPVQLAPEPSPAAPKETRGRRAKTTPTAAPAVPAPAPAPEPSLNGHAGPIEPHPQAIDEEIEAARERLRALARERGVLWLRASLEAAQVARLGQLSDHQVRDLLR